MNHLLVQRIDFYVNITQGEMHGLHSAVLLAIAEDHEWRALI